MSVLEMSHRSAAFDSIIQKAEADLRALAGIGPEHAVLFLQGGASLQFAMLPANLRPEGASADYLLTGHWSKAALQEAQKRGRARVAASTEGSGFDRVPAQAELDLDPAAAYLHYTSNTTIYGTEWPQAPCPPAEFRSCDASSDVLSRPFDARQLGFTPAPKEPGPGRGDAGRVSATCSSACPACRRSSTIA
jgi:phosphoserine aminotransferase